MSESCPAVETSGGYLVTADVDNSAGAHYTMCYLTAYPEFQRILCHHTGLDLLAVVGDEDFYLLHPGAGRPLADHEQMQLRPSAVWHAASRQLLSTLIPLCNWELLVSRFHLYVWRDIGSYWSIFVHDILICVNAILTSISQWYWYRCTTNATSREGSIYRWSKWSSKVVDEAESFHTRWALHYLPILLSFGLELDSTAFLRYSIVLHAHHAMNGVRFVGQKRPAHPHQIVQTIGSFWLMPP